MPYHILTRSKTKQLREEEPYKDLFGSTAPAISCPISRLNQVIKLFQRVSNSKLLTPEEALSLTYLKMSVRRRLKKEIEKEYSGWVQLKLDDQGCVEKI